MKRLWIIIMAMLVLTALYYLATTVFKPSQPQVVVVRPSGAQNTASPATQTPTHPPQAEPITPMGGGCGCAKAMYLKVGSVSLCTDVIYSIYKHNEGLQVDFQGGMVQGVFTFISAPSCTVTTTPQGVLIPCRAQIVIPLKH